MAKFKWISLKGKTSEGVTFNFSMKESNVYIRDGKLNHIKVDKRAAEVMKSRNLKGTLKEVWVPRPADVG